MAKSKKIDKDMGFRLKKARLKIMVMFQALKNLVSSFVLYTSLLIRSFIRQLQLIIWITKDCWFIFQNVQTIR